jgi:hypothetical protein
MNELDGLNGLVPLIDNGGRRSYIDRRRYFNVVALYGKRSKRDRRMTLDRRNNTNQYIPNHLERRTVFLLRNT